jgi:hypothetical protein
MLRLLQKAGADSSQKTSLGRSALQLVDQQTEQFEHISALVENTTDIWRCPESWGTPESSFYILLLDHFSIETHGDLGIPHFKNPPSSPVPRTRRDAKEGWVTLKGNSGQDLGRFEVLEYLRKQV